MISSVADAIAGLLEQEDFTQSWRIAVSEEPAEPNNTITVYDTGGNPPIQTDVNLREPTIQVRVRGGHYPTAIEMQNKIHGFLSVDNVGHITSGMRIVGVWLQSDIMSIGRDDNNRHITTANYRVITH